MGNCAISDADSATDVANTMKQSITGAWQQLMAVKKDTIIENKEFVINDGNINSACSSYECW
jgi:hypothetical protein